MFLIDTQFLQHGLAQFLGHLLRIHIENGTAHDNGLVEESFGLGHTHQCTHLTAATRFAEDGDIIGVASELSDIVAYPFQGLYSIEHTYIT